MDSSLQTSRKAARTATLSWQVSEVRIWGRNWDFVRRLPCKGPNWDVWRLKFTKKWLRMKKEIVLFHQVNALGHRSIKTNYTWSWHTAYLPDLGPIDFYLFADLKKKRLHKRNWDRMKRSSPKQRPHLRPKIIRSKRYRSVGIIIIIMSNFAKNCYFIGHLILKKIHIKKWQMCIL